MMTERTSIAYQISQINSNKLSRHAKMTLRETIQTNPDHTGVIFHTPDTLLTHTTPHAHTLHAKLKFSVLTV